MRWLRHAFAIDSPDPAEPSEPQRELIDRVLREVVRRRLTAPALMLLEMSRPLGYLGSQAMHFFAPIVTTLVDQQGYDHFADFLERRGSVEYLCRRLEEVEAERMTDEGHG